jgi:hypothetical protein
MHVLVQEDRFPTHVNLPALLTRAGAQEYSVVDLLQLVRALTATEPFFETFIKRRAVAADDIEVSPADVIDRLGQDLGATTRNSLVLAAVAQDSGWCPDSTYWATSVWNGSSDWIETTAQVSMVESFGGDLEVLERQISGVIRVLTETKEIEFSHSLEDLYSNPEQAVALVLRRLREYDSTIPSTVVVTAGANFVTSLEAHGMHHHPGLLETVFHRAVLAALGRLGQIKGAKLHWVRTSKAADAPQKERADGAKLWRCMVTQKGAGYRLHFWTLTDGSVELEAVMQESEV